MKKEEFDKIFDAAKAELSVKDGGELVKCILEGRGFSNDDTVDALNFSVCVADYCMLYTNNLVYRVLSEVLVDKQDQ